uniref:Uncharacterized protein n=1 Tax=Bartonella rochalimae ATCC BAA-1498 TaxID=685782 RepID=E6YL61_9HYPH|nr:hypothetical protein BARRO_30180 [Bartonella rochalimae ATCC BAA-1498]
MVNTLQLIIAIHILSITQSATNSSNHIVKKSLYAYYKAVYKNILD